MATRGTSQRTRKQIVRLVDDLESEGRGKRKAKKVHKYTNYYEVAIEAVEEKRVKVHNVGFDLKYDEWKAYDSVDCSDFPVFKYEKLLTPPAESIDERSKAYIIILLRGEIKKKLRPGRRNDLMLDWKWQLTGMFSLFTSVNLAWAKELGEETTESSERIATWRNTLAQNGI